MKIRTSTAIVSTPESIWPLLTNSSMEVPGCFCLGLPKPVSCELPSGEGGVGLERRCISDRGVVVQRITVWVPPRNLQFEMVSTAFLESGTKREAKEWLHSAASGE